MPVRLALDTPKANSDNANFMSISMLGDELNLAYVRVIVQATKETERWHSLQNKTLRSAPDSQKWLTTQVSGGFFSHVTATMKELDSPAPPESCHIVTPSGSTELGGGQ